MSKGTILIVDDEPDALALLAGILTQEGYRVRPADSGKLALAAIAASAPDLILLDMRIGDMDGLEVCRRLKAQETIRDIPIMFISASAEPQERVEGLAMGAVDFVTKPFSRAELLARVRTHLELSMLRSRLEQTVASRTSELLSTVELLRKEIGDHRRTEQALRESEERFRNMADTAPVYMGVFDADQRAIFFNRGWLDFTGRTPEKERGTGWTDSVHPDDLEGCRGALFSMREPEAGGLEYRLRRADGEYRVLLATAAPRFAPDGTFAGHITSCIDITDMKRRQEEALATQKLESLGVLASGIAHDFNNLLGSIVAEADLLALEVENNVSAREIIRNIDGLAVRAAEIVRQLMIYAGQEGVALEQVDLAKLVREMLQLLKVSISKRAVLNVDLPEKLPLIRANAAQIRQVVMNLVTNASEALGDKDGAISVTLAQVRPQTDSIMDQVPALPGGDLLQLEVSDTGCGMSQELQAGIFDPFFTTKSSGRGLGLSAVQGIIRRHGGTIRVESAPGAGSRFEILLPSMTQAEAEEPTIAAPVSPGGNGSFRGTVLIVDDEDMLRVAVSKMLAKKGIGVFETGDGRKAVELFRTHSAKIDVVLLDVTLPGMSGPEVLAELRKLRPDVKVILTTAYGRDRALAAMGDDQSYPYVRKPYKITDLITLLHTVCLDTLAASKRTMHAP
jgi:PAS domain S-box-containing protein